MAEVTPRRDGGAPSTCDTLFEILSSSRRRHFLSHLYGERNVAMSRLPGRIAAEKEEYPAESLTSEQTTPVHTSLQGDVTEVPTDV